MTNIKVVLAVVLAVLLTVVGAGAQLIAKDPGPRGGGSAMPEMLPGLTPSQQMYFADGLADFAEAEGVGDGLGPRFNLDSCAGCHSHPTTGGSSPATNPQMAVATAFGAKNTVPSFITVDGAAT